MAQVKQTIHMADGAVHEVIITNQDRTRWDLTAPRQNWPSIQEAPFLFMTFVAWAGLKRLGIYAEEFERFMLTDCVDIDSEEIASDPKAMMTYPGLG